MYYRLILHVHTCASDEPWQTINKSTSTCQSHGPALLDSWWWHLQCRSRCNLWCVWRCMKHVLVSVSAPCFSLPTPVIHSVNAKSCQKWWSMKCDEVLLRCSSQPLRHSVRLQGDESSPGSYQVWFHVGDGLRWCQKNLEYWKNLSRWVAMSCWCTVASPGTPAQEAAYPGPHFVQLDTCLLHVTRLSMYENWMCTCAYICLFCLSACVYIYTCL